MSFVQLIDPPEDATAIASNSQRCLVSFDRCLSRLASQSQLVKERAAMEDQLGRLNIWSSNMGVFAPMRASLDSRLMFAKDERDIITDILDTLRENIEQATPAHMLNTQRLRHERHTGTSLKVQVPSDVPITRFAKKVEEDINLLLRFSNSIRRAGTEQRDLRAANVVFRDPDGNDLLKIFREEEVGPFLQVQFKNMGEPLRQRMASSIVLRRKRLLYRKQHMLKLSRRSVNIPQQPQRVVKQSPTVQTSSKTKDNEEGSTNKPSAPKPSPASTAKRSSATLDTQATPHDPAAFRKKTAPSTISVVKSAALAKETKEEFPPPPRLKDKDSEFLCPYCCLYLPRRTADERRRWILHLIEDLAPYICVYDECSKGDELFRSTKSWIDHMKLEHTTQWRCAVRIHDPVSFSRKEEFEDHMRTEHKGSFSERQLPLLTERSARSSAPALSICPFCGIQAQDIPQDSFPSHETSTPLEVHVSEHLIHAALRSLPDVNDGHSSAATDIAKRPETRSTIREERRRADPPVFDDDPFKMVYESVHVEHDPAYEHDGQMSASSDVRHLRFIEWEFVLGLPQEISEPNSDPALRNFRLISADLEEVLTQLQATLTKRHDYTNFSVADRHPHTGRWIYDHEDFKAWRLDQRSMLWVTGSMGCGKTALLGNLLSHDGSLASSPPYPLVVSYFFEKGEENLTTFYWALFFSVVSQMRYLPDAIFEKIKSVSISGMPELETDQARDLLSLTLSEACNVDGVHIYVDGLEDYHGVPDGLLHFLDEIMRLCPSTGTLRICVSSRLAPPPGEYYHVIVHENNHNDIEVHIRDLLRRKKSFFNNSDFEELVSRFKLVADGCFQWTNMQWAENIRNEYGEAIAQSIEHSCGGIDSIYNSILAVQQPWMNGAKPEVCFEVLDLVCAARRPLSYFEIGYFLKIVASSDLKDKISGLKIQDVLSRREFEAVCRGMVQVTEDSGGAIVRLTHPYVHDYHFRNPEVIKRANEAMWTVCLHCFESFRIPAPETIFEYTATFWLNHLESLGHSYGLSAYDILFGAAGPKPVVQRWFDCINERAVPELRSKVLDASDGTLLHLAAAFDIDEVARKLLAYDNDSPIKDVKNSSGHTPLMFAAAAGSMKVLNYLLDYEASTAQIDNGGYTAVAYACERGKLEAAMLLLDHGAPVFDYLPLICAARQGHTEIAKLLLNYGARSGGSDGYGFTALHFAASKGNIEIATLLIAKGADPNSKTADGLSALSYASQAGYEELVDLLLQSGADPADMEWMQDRGRTLERKRIQRRTDHAPSRNRPQEYEDRDLTFVYRARELVAPPPVVHQEL